MCGITGILRYEGSPPEQQEIEAMTMALGHRGPDGSGILRRGSLALGHTRLAVIDLSASAAQPMTDAHSRLAVTFNGEICNYKELRSELEKEGRIFQTASDTEVVLQAFDQWREGCLTRFNGMYALCIADFVEKKLFLARDHAGIKPLFYRTGPGVFAFASELAALRQFSTTPLRGSLESIDYYLRFQYIPAPRTIYHDVFKLPPAHWMEVGFDGNLTAPKRYWRLSFKPGYQNGRNVSITERRENVAAVMRQAVKRWLVADVPVGLFLSGGLDSSLVAREAAGLSTKPLQAFSIGFRDAAHNELPYAEQAASTLGLAHCSQVVEHGSLEILPELLDHYGEPFGDSSAIPTWHLSKLAAEKVKTVLSGDGGDEAFGGYGRFISWTRGDRFSRSRRRELWMDLRAGRMRSLRDLFDLLGYGPEAWIRHVQYTFYPQRKKLWRAEYRHLADNQAAPFWNAWRHARGAPGMCMPQSMDFETYLPGAILTKVDVASMFHGLEVRPVLLDRELLEAAAELPEPLKYNDGCAGKLLIQDMLLDTFPQEFVKRPKSGFGIPRGQWLSPGGLGWEMMNDLLLGGGSPLFDFFEPTEIERHVRMHEIGLDNSQHTWLLLVLAIWLDRSSKISFN